MIKSLYTAASGMKAQQINVELLVKTESQENVEWARIISASLP